MFNIYIFFFSFEQGEEKLRNKDELLRLREEKHLQELREKDNLVFSAKFGASLKVREAKAQVKKMAQDFAEKLMKAKEDLERSRGDSVDGDGESSKPGGDDHDGDQPEEVDLNASTQVVPATEQLVRNHFH